MRKYLVIFGLFSLMAMSCSSGEEKAEGTVLARVNDDTLTLEELLYQIPAEYRGQLNSASLSDIIDDWINTEVIYQKALQEGLDKDPEIQAIVKAGTKEAMARKYINQKLTSQVDISPAKVDSIYQEQKNQYKLDKDRYRAKHILLQKAGDADAIYKRLKEGADFSDLARDYSMDRRSADRGGDIGYFTDEDIDPVFVNAVKDLKIGSYTKPFKTPYGFHILMLTDKQKAGADLDSLEVKRKIMDDLYTEGHTDAFQALLDELKSSSKIEKFPVTDSMLATGLGSGLP